MLFKFEVSEFGWAVVQFGTLTFRASYVSDCLNDFADALLRLCSSPHAQAVNVWYEEPEETRVAYRRRNAEVEVVVSRRTDPDAPRQADPDFGWDLLNQFSVDLDRLVIAAVDGFDSVDRTLYRESWPQYEFPEVKVQLLHGYAAS